MNTAQSHIVKTDGGHTVQPQSRIDRIGWRQIFNGMKALTEAFRLRGQRVSQQEAERRAAICAGCPENKRIECPSCERGRLEQMARIISGAGTTSKDSQLLQCAVCGCWLKAAVWAPLEVHQRAGSTASAPEWCWKRGLPDGN